MGKKLKNKKITPTRVTLQYLRVYNIYYGFAFNSIFSYSRVGENVSQGFANVNLDDDERVRKKENTRIVLVGEKQKYTSVRRYYVMPRANFRSNKIYE